MLSFGNDYSEGVHPKILQRLIDTNEINLAGYCDDVYCISAREKIRAACKTPTADVFFFVGGTQTNATVLDVLLGNNQGVIAASTGHINTHEAGAVEFTGHKVLALPQVNGKIPVVELVKYLEEFYDDSNNVQMVFPKVVYLSHPTEYGTLYSKNELVQISKICKEYKILLYIDGARLGYGLASPDSDLELSDFASLCDAFYIGGTKVGALCGEAIVFPQGNAPEHFPTIMKQHGALLAKGRLLGVQFDALFTDNLYIDISRNAIVCAKKLCEVFQKWGIPIFIKVQTNQIFVILESDFSKKLAKEVAFRFWRKLDDNHIIARFVTSWATKPESIDILSTTLEKICNSTKTVILREKTSYPISEKHP